MTTVVSPGVDISTVNKVARPANPQWLLPDPETRARTYAIVSVDDHLLEPPDTFEGRLPARFAERSPRLIERDDGAHCWRIGTDERPLLAGNACVGRPPEEWQAGALRFDEVRKGAWDLEARIADMDLAGVYASVGFPSMAWGFSGQYFSTLADHDLGIACVRAYNDWVVEAWAGPHPDRIIPCTIPYFADVNEAVREIERNAARGVRATCFSEMPALLGYPSPKSGHWDPFFRACEETGTVLNLHLGSGSWTPKPSPDSSNDVVGTLFAVTSLMAAADWLWSLVPLRFPDLRIVLSEGGLGWLPMLIDRLVHMRKHQPSHKSWPEDAPPPEEVLFRNFRFASYFDPSIWRHIDEYDVNAIMVEVDYPHGDSTWPDSQEHLARQIGHLDRETVAKVTYRNACKLFGHPEPPPGWAEVMA